MRCLMAVWSSHREWLLGTWMNPGPSLPPALQTQLQSSDGWNRPEPTSALFMGAESTLPVCPHMAQWMPSHGGGKKGRKKKKKKRKDIWHWNELYACNSSSGDGKWLQFVIWTFQRWKRGRPPELSWASLLFQSCSPSSMGCWSRDLEGLLTCNVLCSGTEWVVGKGQFNRLNRELPLDYLGLYIYMFVCLCLNSKNL